MTTDIPTAPATFVLPQAMSERIIAHARRELPRECCGLIGGAAGIASELHELTNLEPGVDRYLIDDAEVYQIYRDWDDRGFEIVAIYHSHPTSPAYPSATDVSLAFWSEATYLICSLEDPEAPSLRAFRIVDECITEIPVSHAQPGA